MLVRLFIFALISGAVGVTAALGFGLSVWALPLVYSLVGTSVLLGGGLVAAVVQTGRPDEPDYRRAHIKPAGMRLRH